MSIELVIIIALFLMIVFPTILLILLRKHQKTLKICTVILMVIYFTLLFIGTAFKVYVKNGNLVIYSNFKYDWFSMKFIPFSFTLTNTLVNLSLLLPTGFIVFIFAKKHKFIKTILFDISLSCFI